MFPFLLGGDLLGGVETVPDGTASFPIPLSPVGVLGSAQQAPQHPSSVPNPNPDGSSLWFRSHFPSHITIIQKEKLRFRKGRGPAGDLAARIGRGKT